MSFFKWLRETNKQLLDNSPYVSPLQTGIFFGGSKLLEKGFEKIEESAEIEGKKKGYERAAEEFQPILRQIEKQYEEAFAVFEKSRALKINSLKEHALLLRKLEKEKEDLLKILENKKQTNDFDDMPSSLTGTVYVNWFKSIRDEFIDEYETIGYEEAKKEIWDKEIRKLKSKLARLKNDSDEELAKIQGSIDKCMKEIIVIQKKIADINILIEG